MTSPLTDLTAEERDRLKPEKHPQWHEPMTAVLTDERFSDPGWIYERKLDGERALAIRDGAKFRLMTRNRKEITDTYPELVDALKAQTRKRFVVDGEIVAFKGSVSSFSRLQKRLQIKNAREARRSGVAVYFYIFDIVNLDGHALECLPLRKRKALLKAALDFEEPLRFTPHRNRDGEAYYEEACEKGWEGVIAKRADSPYLHKRSRDWLKFKCSKGQELVIGGFTEPEGERIGFGALLVGYYRNGQLRYAGKVGTGYDHETLKHLRRRMDGLARKSSPFADEVPERDVTWISPKLIGEFQFTEWTKDGKLRHPRFLGLRRDKAPKDVTRETPDD